MNYLLNYNKFVSTKNVEKLKNKETDIEDVNKNKEIGNILTFDAFFDKLLMIEKKSNNSKMIKE